MNTTEKNTFIKETTVSALRLDTLCAKKAAYQIDNYTYAIPVEVDGTIRYAKVVVSATNDKEVAFTKGVRAGSVNKAFNLIEAIFAYDNKLLAAEEKKKKTKTKTTKEVNEGEDEYEESFRNIPLI